MTEHRLQSDAMRKRGEAVLRWAALSCVAIVGVSSCYASTDYGTYPEGKIVQSGSLVREWTGEGEQLVLKANDAFSASRLQLRYFQCPSDGIQRKSGDGSWSTIEDGGSTSVLIRFEDGCSATLWAGESEGRTVLWATQGGEGRALILR